MQTEYIHLNVVLPHFKGYDPLKDCTNQKETTTTTNDKNKIKFINRWYITTICRMCDLKIVTWQIVIRSRGTTLMCDNKYVDHISELQNICEFQKKKKKWYSSVFRTSCIYDLFPYNIHNYIIVSSTGEHLIYSQYLMKNIRVGTYTTKAKRNYNNNNNIGKYVGSMASSAWRCSMNIQ